ncbi:NADP-dependent isocitrate dehydrogenase [Gemmatimonas sp.]|uniref:NADP-dependent isocitrate dehydrogenase n=1 Tax=Gemmatimonas sp. TaxID=1962908 RepID=UPI0035632666
MSNVPITIAHGDGIGPEIMRATLRVLEAAGARLAPETIEIGEAVYYRGQTAGIELSAWESLRRTKVFLKSPITTPSGGGFKSLNVTVRKTLGLYANVRPCVSYDPYVATHFPGVDTVIVRENEEDLYAGIEHRQSDEVYQCLKLVSRPGCEKIVRYAFEYARVNGRKRVTCMTKDNIMKLTDGLFHKVFDEIAKEYPGIANDHMIIDIGAARLATRPQTFDVIVTLNLYGDIISDIAAEVTGSVGLGGSANIGDQCAMFEAVHGSAPDIAGKGIANPSGLLLAAVMMLVHIGQGDVAEKIHNAWLTTLEAGVHTGDIFHEKVSELKVGTDAFADAVIERLGQRPARFTPVEYAGGTPVSVAGRISVTHPAVKTLLGVDVFLHWRGAPNVLGPQLEALNGDGLELTMISNRGVKVYPDGMPETFCTDHWRCRFQSTTASGTVTLSQVLSVLMRVGNAGLDFVKTEHLYAFDGVSGFSLGQGQ